MKTLFSFLAIWMIAASMGCNNRSSRSGAAAEPPLPTVESGSSSNDGMGVLDLPNGSKFATTLYDLKVIGQLKSAHKLPYYVLSGIGCNGCDANVSIYIHSPSDGPMHDEGTQPRFDYPGRGFRREDHRVDSETRVFLGDCAPGHPDAVIWFYHLLGEDKQWHDSVDVAEVRGDKLFDWTPESDVPTLAEAEDAVRKSRCTEVPGLDQFEEP